MEPMGIPLKLKKRRFQAPGTSRCQFVRGLEAFIQAPQQEPLRHCYIIVLGAEYPSPEKVNLFNYTRII